MEDDINKILLDGAQSENLDQIRRALNAGAEVNAVTRTLQLPPLYIAAHQGNEEIVKELLSRGADVNFQSETYGGISVLMVALLARAKGVARELVSHGAELDLQNKRGKTALMYAISERMESLALLMIEKGANLDLQNNDGRTALMYAVDERFNRVAEKIIEKGTDLDAKDKEGHTALALAVLRKNKNIAEKLLTAGARKDPAAHDYAGELGSLRETLMQQPSAEVRDVETEGHNRGTGGQERTP